MLVRVLAGLAVVLLAGTATAIAGPIGFVGLAVPHVARTLVGRGLSLDSAVVDGAGARPCCCLLMSSGGLVARPDELQVGIITALIGAPLFIALVRRRRLAEL